MTTWQRTVTKEAWEGALGIFLFFLLVIVSHCFSSVSETFQTCRNAWTMCIFFQSPCRELASCWSVRSYSCFSCECSMIHCGTVKVWCMRWGVVQGSAVALVSWLLFSRQIYKNCLTKVKGSNSKNKSTLEKNSKWIWYSIILVFLCTFSSWGNSSSFLWGTVQNGERGRLMYFLLLLKGG